MTIFSFGEWLITIVSFPILRPEHLDKVFADMKEIMTMIIKESENILMQFLSIFENILINSVKKENKVLLLIEYMPSLNK